MKKRKVTKQKINITIDKPVYKWLTKKPMKVSRYINEMLLMLKDMETLSGAASSFNLKRDLIK